MLINLHRIPKVEKENKMIMKVQSEIIRSIKIQIIFDQNRDKTILMNIGDVVEVDYVDELQIKTVIGKLVKFGYSSLTIDSSKEYISSLTDILICNIRDIKDPNNKEEKPPVIDSDGVSNPENPPKDDDKQEPVQPGGSEGTTNPDQGEIEDNKVPKPPQENIEPPKKPEGSEGEGPKKDPEHETENGKEEQIESKPSVQDNNKKPEDKNEESSSQGVNKLPLTNEPIIVPLQK